MDVSDDIAYSVHDVEDAIQQNLVHPDVLCDSEQRARIWELGRQWYGDKFSFDELDEAAHALVKEGLWLDSYDDSYRSFAALKDMTSQLIGRFCEAVHDATRATYGDEPLHRFDCDLVIERHTAAEIQVLKNTAVAYMMAPREVDPYYLQQRTLLFDLVEALSESRGEELDEPYRSAYMVANSDAERLRAIVDNVASMTDYSAQQRHASLVGMITRL